MNLSVKALAQAIGQTIGMRVEGFIIPVTIKDVKQAYGTVRFLVKPVSGAGEAWCEISRFSKLTGTSIMNFPGF